MFQTHDLVHGFEKSNSSALSILVAASSDMLATSPSSDMSWSWLFLEALHWESVPDVAFQWPCIRLLGLSDFFDDVRALPLGKSADPDEPGFMNPGQGGGKRFKKRKVDEKAPEAELSLSTDFWVNTYYSLCTEEELT